MTKIKTFWKSHYLSLLIFIGILLIISPVILSRPLNNLDEVWNYNFARNVTDGLVPYRDFNMLQTPLLTFIASLFLLIFGNELFVMRILAILLISTIFFVIYQILKKLKVNIFYNLCCLLLLFLLLKEHICIDYNFAVLLLTLILINISISAQQKHSNLFYILIGLINGSCILLKQSTGILIAFASIIYPIFLISNKINFKQYIRITLLKILGILIPVTLLTIYLLINNAFSDFIDYTILGIKTFSNSIPYTNLINSGNLVIKCISIGLPIFILASSIYLLRKKRKMLYGFYFYSIASLIVIYPISDHIHFLIGIIPFIVLFAYLIFNFFTNRIKKENTQISQDENINNLMNNSDNSTQNENNHTPSKMKLFLIETSKAVIVLSLLCYLISSFISLTSYLYNSEKNHTITHYKNIPISEGLLHKINEIDNYILFENNPVYILDSEAAIYMISINHYNKDFDMFLKGNLGSQGEVGQIEKIKQLEIGSKILIKNDQYKLNWQTPLEVISFIKNNLTKIGEINIFDIYEVN